MTKTCFYCGGKFYDHENDRFWRVGNHKGDVGHIECWNEAKMKLQPPGKAYDDLMAGIKSIQFNDKIVRYEKTPRELPELKEDWA